MKQLILLVVLILLSAFFSSSETSYMSLSKLTLRRLIKEKKRNAKIMFRLKEKKELLLSTILVGNNIVNTFASSFAAALAISLCGKSGIGIATVLMTILIILFGEILPKTIASHKSESIARIFAKPLSFSEIILFPVSIIFTGISRFITFLIEINDDNKLPVVTEEELKMLIDVGSQEGTLESGEKELMHKIFEFTDLHVRNVMTNKALIDAVPVSSSYEEVVECFHKTGRSRIPVYETNLDSICGVIYYKDILFNCTSEYSRQSFDLRNFMKEPFFAPESMSAVALLRLLKKENRNFAVAVDEHGCNSGIITLDDLLSAVFGRIREQSGSEYLAPEERIQFINQNEVRVPGDILLTDFNAFFKCNLESDFYQTLAGWMLERFDLLPGMGDLLRTDNMIFIVEQQYQRAIKQVRVKIVR